MKTKNIKITNSKNTVTRTWLVGRDYGCWIARPEASYDEMLCGPATTQIEVEHEAMFAGSHDEWMLSIASRIEAHMGEEAR